MRLTTEQGQKEEIINQCDGCMAHIPLRSDGMHDGGTYNTRFCCTADRYKSLPVTQAD